MLFGCHNWIHLIRFATASFPPAMLKRCDPPEPILRLQPTRFKTLLFNLARSRLIPKMSWSTAHGSWPSHMLSVKSWEQLSLSCKVWEFDQLRPHRCSQRLPQLVAKDIARRSGAADDGTRNYPQKHGEWMVTHGHWWLLTVKNDCDHFGFLHHHSPEYMIQGPLFMVAVYSFHRLAPSSLLRITCCSAYWWPQFFQGLPMNGVPRKLMSSQPKRNHR